MNNTVLFFLVAILFTGCISGKRYRLKLVKRDPIEKSSLIKRMSPTASLPAFDKKEQTLSFKKKKTRAVFLKEKNKPVATFSSRKILRYSWMPPQVDEVSESGNKKKIGRHWYLIGASFFVALAIILVIIQLIGSYYGLLPFVITISGIGLLMSALAMINYEVGDTTFGIVLAWFLFISSIFWGWASVWARYFY